MLLLSRLAELLPEDKCHWWKSPRFYGELAAAMFGGGKGSKAGRAGKGTSGAVSNAEQIIKNAAPNNLISRQSSNEMSGSDIKRLVKNMKKNGFDTTQPIDVAIVNGKTINIDGHHRAAAAAKAGIKDIPIRINKLTESQGNQLLLEAAEARSRY